GRGPGGRGRGGGGGADVRGPAGVGRAAGERGGAPGGAGRRAAIRRDGGAGRPVFRFRGREPGPGAARHGRGRPFLTRPRGPSQEPAADPAARRSRRPVGGVRAGRRLTARGAAVGRARGGRSPAGGVDPRRRQGRGPTHPCDGGSRRRGGVGPAFTVAGDRGPGAGRCGLGRGPARHVDRLTPPAWPRPPGPPAWPASLTSPACPSRPIPVWSCSLRFLSCPARPRRVLAAVDTTIPGGRRQAARGQPRRRMNMVWSARTTTTPRPAMMSAVWTTLVLDRAPRPCPEVSASAAAAVDVLGRVDVAGAGPRHELLPDGVGLRVGNLNRAVQAAAAGPLEVDRRRLGPHLVFAAELAGQEGTVEDVGRGEERAAE